MAAKVGSLVTFRPISFEEIGRVRPHDSLEYVIESLKTAEGETLVVISEENQLLGTITYGDLLNFTIVKTTLPARAVEFMNKSPKVLTPHIKPSTLAANSSILRLLPVVSTEGKLISGYVQRQGYQRRIKDWTVLLMAGGRGQRLRPLTDSTPKPLISVGGVPISERLVFQLATLGFHDIYISVNYLGDQIREHFGDGKHLGCNINYLEEAEPLGTAGALVNLPQSKTNVLMLNGDLITELDFRAFANAHLLSGSILSMVTREVEVKSEFGVVETNDRGEITSLKEKPSTRHLVNAGIYAVNLPAIRKMVPPGPLQATDLVANLIAKNNTVNSFVSSDFWLDLGRLEDLDKANKALTAISHFSIRGS